MRNSIKTKIGRIFALVEKLLTLSAQVDLESLIAQPTFVKNLSKEIKNILKREVLKL